MARASYKDWITKDGLSRIEGWARDGLTNEQIAKNIGCTRTTLQAWIKDYPDISDALKRGKAPVDFEVENALLKRALGYQYEETRKYVTMGENGTHKQVIETRTREVPPDTGAIIFWLKNRRPAYWRNSEYDMAPGMDTVIFEGENDV